MRPVSGEDLVTAALQSSLARAQKNYKLSNHKKLSPGESFKTKQSGNGLGVGGKAHALKFQSEFDLWVEQATEFTFVSEGYTNGATVPKNIECLNSNYVPGRKLKLKKKSTPEKSALLKRDCESTAEVDGKNKPRDRDTSLKGKDKLKTAVGTENSFEIFKKLKETRKEKKKWLKLKKKLLKQGHSVEEAESLIQSPNGSAGAIQKQLEWKSAKKGGGAESLLKQQQLGKNKRIKMKDLVENGESASAGVSGPKTPPSQGSSSGSQSMNGGCSSGSSGYGSGSSSGSSSNSSSSPSQGHQLPKPKRILYPREKIVPGYTEKLPVGAGFYNMGNSCYLNASLQAVFHVPAFINWLRHDVDHRRQCQDNVNCIICAMKKTLDSAMSRQNSAPNAIRPVEIINRLRSICRHFSHGRQEDAHEFLRYLFESMEKSYLSAINGLRLDNRTKETNPLGQIFGGYLRTEVTCLKCHYVSTTFQPTAELQLDIRHVTTLEDAIMNHFKKERLDNNDYKCEKCRTISQATKQFSLEVPPVVLCLQLKRFTLYGTKIAKRIHCNRSLNMSKYMHKSKQVNGFSDLRYRLVALVTHLGSSPNCGHYTAIAEAANGSFYQFDDAYVHPVTTANALNNDAYVIIYEMDKRAHKPPEPSSAASSSGYSTNLSFPSSTVTSSSSSSSTPTLFPKKLPSTPIPKVPSFQSKFNTEHESKKESLPNGNSSTSEKVNGNSNNITNGTKGLTLDRKLISFGLSTNTPKKINILKPGASLTNSSKLGIQSNGNSASNSAVASSSPMSKEKSDQTIKLVPYNDDEESDKDEGRVLSNGKRLKSPEKQSPARNPELPITPPKSPKSANNSSAVSGASAQAENTVKRNCSPKPSVESVGAPKSENSVPKDCAKRKAPSDEDTPRKSRPHRRRRSSSSSSTSSNSSTTCSDSKSKKSNESKRKREECPRSLEKKSSSSHHSSDSRRDRDHNHRESYSQERDRERRRDRNPSRSPSLDAEKDKRASSDDRKRSESATDGIFDVSRLKHENSIVGWDGQKSLLSRSLEEDRKRSNAQSLDEDYDNEFDQGRTKKVRRSLSLPRESEGYNVGNRFQNVVDKKKQVEAWSKIMNSGSKTNSDSKSWTNEDDSSRHRKGFASRPSSSNSGIGSRPRHSSSHSSSNYQRSHGRSPFKNGHHSSNGGNHYRNQHHYNGGNKHWSSNNDRNRH
ncbi:unnamed protein product [Orchesella dallaii]